MNTLSLINLIAGICLLLYGVEIVSSQLQSTAGGKFRHILSSFTSNPFKGALAGAGITALVQSSTVTSVILVTFVNSGVMTLQQSIGVILGADIGSTVTIQLIAFRIFDYAMVMIAGGLIFKFIGISKISTFIGNLFLGFGFIFFSIQLMTDAVRPLGGNDLFREVMTALSNAPVYGIIISAAFTALVHSSAVTIGIVIALAIYNLIDLHQAMPLIFGANIGTCATAMISAIGAIPDAKRVAGAHALFKTLGVLIFLPFIKGYVHLVELSSIDVARQIANGHTFFNIAIALLFLPFTGIMAKLTTLLVPSKEPGIEPFRPKYLDDNILSNPSLALGESVRESLRIADIVSEMFKEIIPAFSTSDEMTIKKTSEKDDRIDILENAVKLYITKLSQLSLTNEQSKRQVSILSSISNFENIGDIIDKNLMELAMKKIRLGVDFSEQGWGEIKKLHEIVMENLQMVVASFASRDIGLAKKVLDNKQIISQAERNYRQAHIDRLREGLKESIETSEIHLDILTNLKRINSHITAIAYSVLDQ